MNCKSKIRSNIQSGSMYTLERNIKNKYLSFQIQSRRIADSSKNQSHVRKPDLGARESIGIEMQGSYDYIPARHYLT